MYKCDLCAFNGFKVKKQLSQDIGLHNSPYKIVMCKRCGLHSLFPIPSDEDFKSIYENYAEKGNRIEVEKLRMKAVYQHKTELIKKYLKKDNLKILDIGAGLGGFVSVAKSAGYDVTGIELEEEQVKLAKSLFNVDLVNDKYENYHNKYGQKFDVIHLHHVLEHLQSPSNILKLIKNQLTQDSLVLVEVPNQFSQFPQDMKFKLRLLSYSKPHNPYHHLYFFSPKTIAKLFTKEGFLLKEINTIAKPTTSIKSKLKFVLANIFKLPTSNVIEIVARKN